MSENNFPRRLRELRRSAGLSCNELNRRAELGNGMVSRLERGDYAPSLDTARKLARALGEKSLACWD